MAIFIWFILAVHVIMDYCPFLQKQKDACNVRTHFLISLTYFVSNSLIYFLSGSAMKPYQIFLHSH